MEPELHAPAERFGPGLPGSDGEYPGDVLRLAGRAVSGMESMPARLLCRPIRLRPVQDVIIIRAGASGESSARKGSRAP